MLDVLKQCSIMPDSRGEEYENIYCETKHICLQSDIWPGHLWKLFHIAILRAILEINEHDCFMTILDFYMIVL